MLSDGQMVYAHLKDRLSAYNYNQIWAALNELRSEFAIKVVPTEDKYKNFFRDGTNYSFAKW